MEAAFGFAFSSDRPITRQVTALPPLDTRSPLTASSYPHNAQKTHRLTSKSLNKFWRHVASAAIRRRQRLKHAMQFLGSHVIILPSIRAHLGLRWMGSLACVRLFLGFERTPPGAPVPDDRLPACMDADYQDDKGADRCPLSPTGTSSNEDGPS